MQKPLSAILNFSFKIRLVCLLNVLTLMSLNILFDSQIIEPKEKHLFECSSLLCIFMFRFSDFNVKEAIFIAIKV